MNYHPLKWVSFSPILKWSGSGAVFLCSRFSKLFSIASKCFPYLLLVRTSWIGGFLKLGGLFLTFHWSWLTAIFLRSWSWDHVECLSRQLEVASAWFSSFSVVRLSCYGRSLKRVGPFLTFQWSTSTAVFLQSRPPDHVSIYHQTFSTSPKFLSTTHMQSSTFPVSHLPSKAHFSMPKSLFPTFLTAAFLHSTISCSPG
jgi:hypothetical protein